jgi:hypothetical protein
LQIGEVRDRAPRNFLAAHVAFSQNGPGGVGDLTGTSSLEVWMDANDLNGDDDFSNNPSNGTLVSTWTDKSGNGNDLTSSGNNRPVYNTGGTYNAVNFINSGGTTFDYMTFATAKHLIPGTAIFVLIPTDAGTVSNSLMDDTNRSLRLEQYNNTNVLGYTRYGTADYNTTIATNYGNYIIVSFRKNTGTNNLLVTQNGTLQTISISSSTNGIPLTRMGAILAADAPNYNCVEIIAHSSYLNDAEIRIVENYLSAKYGGISIPNDDYTMDNPSNGNYDYEVAGIGRVNSSNTHYDAQSSIVRIHNPLGVSSGEYIYWGHDNGLLNSSSADVPSGVEARFMRVWGLNEIGIVNSVDVTFDLTNHTPVTTSDLRLLIDVDNDGIFNEASTLVISGAVLTSANRYTFTYDFPSNSSLRITLGTADKIQTPLPVQLTDFTATASGDGVVDLDWETASEQNNDFFTVKRSIDGHGFDDLFQVPGAGTSSVPHVYHRQDETPPMGRVYYSLHQTDQDGTVEHLKTVSVIVPQYRNDAELYPNPW